MVNRFSAFMFVGALALTSVCALGQFEVNGPNARLTLQGNVPSTVDPTLHDVPVPVSGVFDIDVETGANGGVGIILLGSIVDPTGPVVTGLPWGGSIDVGMPNGMGTVNNVTVFGDGIGLSVNPVTDIFFASNQGSPFAGTPPTFTLTYAVGAGLAGSRLAFQSIVSDVTNPPFNLDNTEVGDANFILGQIEKLDTGEAGSVTIPFANGNTFNFHGVNYTDVSVCANGYVTFGGATNLAAGGFDNDNVTWINDRPAIACAWTHWDPVASSPTDGVLYEEIGNSLRIAWGDPAVSSSGGLSHFADFDSNLLEITMRLDDGVDPMEGEFDISATVLDPAATFEFGNGLSGHTPGSGAVSGGIFDVHLRSVSQVGGPNEAQIEEHDFDGTNVSNAGFDGAGTVRSYNNITINWNGASVHFVPTPAVTVTGDQGYISTPPALAEPADVTGIGQGSLQDSGSETITVGGSFFGFSPTGLGTVSVEDLTNPGVPIPGTAIVGVLDDSGNSGALATPNTSTQDPVTLQRQARDGQALQFLTPPLFGVLNAQVVITFESGEVFTVGPLTVTSTGVIFTSATLGDDANQSHALTVPVTYYGTVFSSLFLNSNGYVSFGAGANDFTETEAEFFGGWGVPPNPGVGAYYSDLNNGGIGSGATYDVTEDTANQTVIVGFNNQNHWSSNDPAGSFSVTFGTFGPNSLTQDYTAFIPALTSTDDGIIGVTDGDVLVGMDTSHSNGLGTGLGLQIGLLSDIPGTGPNSHCETIPANTPISSAMYNWIDPTGLGEYTLF